ncbi:hypothetical protein SAMN05444278_105171 [Psychroflexus salarius]|uniref:tRNA (Guanine-N1)-methyltransferase n=1 Tax=Psychroflexus salarius TaxID=1155689 RepID=A0A1M4WAE7_9FLAO|nr:hypothetical protein [Psychroflexus salarius]SHE78214.1 hypothetical protein SAMN05444278_105171 [Psychroflexus salarius]
MKLQLKLLPIVMFSFLLAKPSQAQNKTDSTANSVIKQFETTISKANNYQDYKVVKKQAIRSLQNEVTNEIDRLESKINNLDQIISKRNETIKSLKAEVSSLKTKNSSLENQQEEMKLFGSISLTKTTYRLVLWSIVAVLLLLLLFFMFRFRRSHIINAEIKANLKNLDQEFQNYKHNALEKQQKLGRQLQDAKNDLQKIKKDN